MPVIRIMHLMTNRKSVNVSSEDLVPSLEWNSSLPSVINPNFSFASRSAFELVVNGSAEYFIGARPV